jgi:MurNAc alpha-1-phosphate uridylyltransferase
MKTADLKMPRFFSGEVHPFAFSGYQFLSPEIFNYNKREGKFSMIDWYLDICKEHSIKAYHHDADTWIDIGSEEELKKANEAVSKM